MLLQISFHQSGSLADSHEETPRDTAEELSDHEDSYSLSEEGGKNRSNHGCKTNEGGSSVAQGLDDLSADQDTDKRPDHTGLTDRRLPCRHELVSRRFVDISPIVLSERGHCQQIAHETKVIRFHDLEVIRIAIDVVWDKHSRLSWTP